MSSSNREPDFFDIFLRSFNFRRRKSEKQDDDDDATRTNERMFIVKDLFMDGICERRKKTRLIHLASVRKLAKKKYRSCPCLTIDISDSHNKKVKSIRWQFFSFASAPQSLACIAQGVCNFS